MPPRKKRDAEDTPLVPENEFEDAVRAVLKASPEKVAKKFDQMQASNKRQREKKKASGN